MSVAEPAAALRVVHLDRREVNALELEDALYLFLGPEDPALVPARCPHRGGPLHLATVEDGAHGAALICPWHGTRVPLRALRRRALAAVQSGPFVRVVIEAATSAEIVPRHIPVRLEAGACAPCAGDPTKGSPPP